MHKETPPSPFSPHSSTIMGAANRNSDGSGGGGGGGGGGDGGSGVKGQRKEKKKGNTWSRGGSSILRRKSLNLTTKGAIDEKSGGAAGAGSGVGAGGAKGSNEALSPALVELLPVLEMLEKKNITEKVFSLSLSSLCLCRSMDI